MNTKESDIERNGDSRRTIAHRAISARYIWGALTIVVLVSGMYFGRLSGTDAQVYRNDFNVFYHAAREVLAGRDPYQSSLGDWTPYLYPPLLAELLAPMALLPLPVAAYLWFVINAAAMLASALMSAKLAAADSSNPGVNPAANLVALIAAASLAVVARFVLDNFALGQVNPLVAYLCVAHVYLYSRDRKIGSAIAFVLAGSIKLTPALLILYPLAKGRIKFAAGCAGLLIAVTGLSFLPMGSNATAAMKIFIGRTIQNQQGFDFAYAGNQSLRGAIERLAADAGETTGSGERSRQPASPAALVASLLLILVAVFAARRARDDVAAAAPFFVLIVVLSPLSWKAHFVVLVLPIAYLIGQALKPARTRSWIVFCLTATFILFNVTSPSISGLRVAEWCDAHSLVLAGALVVLIGTLISSSLNTQGGGQERSAAS